MRCGLGKLGVVLMTLLVSLLQVPARGEPERKGAMRPVGTDLSLDGGWQVGIDRNYTVRAKVPGLAQDPGKPTPGMLWYRREISLPEGGWRQATLTLKGARFAPTVYVNGKQVSSAAGGMAPTVHVLRSPDVRPGAKVTLEIALKSLDMLDPQDASTVPEADRWRTNISSGLWDSVTLHLSGDSRITSITPFPDWASRKVAIHWQTAAAGTHEEADGSASLRAMLIDDRGNIVAQSAIQGVSSARGVLDLFLPHSVAAWSPEHPVLYRLRLEETRHGRLEDAREISWGWRDFRAADKRFYLNGHPEELRGATVMWQRFLRDPQAKEVAFDQAWFRRNVVLPLKSRGGNLLRFNLSPPPESFLDVCDREGLMVQFEWPFLHGIKASEESLREQWRAWLDVAMRHPSVVILHPWNETQGDDLKRAWSAIDEVLKDYPPVVLARRDTLHLHKFWWSFENLGLYYDSAEQFDRPVMVDEFGGNYISENGEPGDYPSLQATFLRYLGREQSKDLRLEFNAESNARVAEYWRRIGAAGFAPFCILGSPLDGSTWFLGHLDHPQLMPVWDAMTAAWSPQSVSLDVWDHNYLPGQRVRLPLVFFNDTGSSALLHARVRIVDLNGGPRVMLERHVEQRVPAYAQARAAVSLTLPAIKGNWRFEGELTDAVPRVEHSIVSSWKFQTLFPAVPAQIAGIKVGVPDQEAELRNFLMQNGLRPVPLQDSSAKIILTSSKTWERLTHEPQFDARIGNAVERGVSIVMLDAGPRDLGQGYRAGDLGPLESAPGILPGAAPVRQEIFAGLSVEFDPVAEPESHIQPGPQDASLWAGLSKDSTWLWNGLRGGLIAPAEEMKVNATGRLALAANGETMRVLPLSTCGAGLKRTAVAEVTFGAGKGNVILSQALTAGRLLRGAAEPGLYGVRYDPAAEQFVLNMLARALTRSATP